MYFVGADVLKPYWCVFVRIKFALLLLLFCFVLFCFINCAYVIDARNRTFGCCNVSYHCLYASLLMYHCFLLGMYLLLPFADILLLLKGLINNNLKKETLTSTCFEILYSWKMYTGTLKPVRRGHLKRGCRSEGLLG
jgi:hypothetical protein